MNCYTLEQINASCINTINGGWSTFLDRTTHHCPHVFSLIVSVSLEFAPVNCFGLIWTPNYEKIDEGLLKKRAKVDMEQIHALHSFYSTEGINTFLKISF